MFEHRVWVMMIQNKLGAGLLVIFFIVLIPVYVYIFSKEEVNHDNLFLGLLSTLLLNQ